MRLLDGRKLGKPIPAKRSQKYMKNQCIRRPQPVSLPPIAIVSTLEVNLSVSGYYCLKIIIIICMSLVILENNYLVYLLQDLFF